MKMSTKEAYKIISESLTDGAGDWYWVESDYKMFKANSFIKNDEIGIIIKRNKKKYLNRFFNFIYSNLASYLYIRTRVEIEGDSTLGGNQKIKLNRIQNYKIYSLIMKIPTEKIDHCADCSCININVDKKTERSIKLDKIFGDWVK